MLMQSINSLLSLFPKGETQHFTSTPLVSKNEKMKSAFMAQNLCLTGSASQGQVRLMNCKVKILGKSFYSPSLKDVAGLESVQLRF